MKKRIFVYEHLTASTPAAGGAFDGARGESAERTPDAALPDFVPPDAALLAMGRSMRDAVAADLLALEVYDVTIATPAAAATSGGASATADPLPPGARGVAPQSNESAFEFVARQADLHHLVWVIAPETGGVLARLNRAVDPARWLGCSAEAIALASAKRATLLRLAAAGLTTPLAFEHAAEITRWVVKPDDGAGAVDTQVHSSLDAALHDWSTRSHGGSPMAIEPWVEGPALSLSLICGPAGCELLSINRQHVVVDAAGRVAYRGVEVGVLPIEPGPARRRPTGAPVAAALRAFAERAVHAIPGLRGFVGIDLVWHAQRGPVAIEVNPRVTCAYAGLSRRLDRPLGVEVIAACAPHGPADANQPHQPRPPQRPQPQPPRGAAAPSAASPSDD